MTFKEFLNVHANDEATYFTIANAYGNVEIPVFACTGDFANVFESSYSTLMDCEVAVKEETQDTFCIVHKIEFTGEYELSDLFDLELSFTPPSGEDDSEGNYCDEKDIEIDLSNIKFDSK